MSAGALQQRFALALNAEAPGMFLELAELLPSPEKRAQLLQAAQQAGWAASAGTAGADLQEYTPLKVHPPSPAPSGPVLLSLIVKAMQAPGCCIPRKSQPFMLRATLTPTLRALWTCRLPGPVGRLWTAQGCSKPPRGSM